MDFSLGVQVEMVQPRVMSLLWLRERQKRKRLQRQLQLQEFQPGMPMSPMPMMSDMSVPTPPPMEYPSSQNEDQDEDQDDKMRRAEYPSYRAYREDKNIRRGNNLHYVHKNFQPTMTMNIMGQKGVSLRPGDEGPILSDSARQQFRDRMQQPQMSDPNHQDESFYRGRRRNDYTNHLNRREYYSDGQYPYAYDPLLYNVPSPSAAPVQNDQQRSATAERILQEHQVMADQMKSLQQQIDTMKPVLQKMQSNYS